MQKAFYPISEARKQLGALIHQVKHSGEIIALGHHHKTEVYLVPVDYVATGKAAEPEKTMTLEDAGHLCALMHDTLSILEEAIFLHKNDHNPMHFYYWAAQKKSREILDDIFAVNQALIKGNFDLKKLKILPDEKAQWLAQIAPLKEIPLDEMDQLKKWVPVYLEAINNFFCSLAP